MSSESKTTVLVIGGLDPSAGAGILADIKTIAAFGCYGVGAVTSLTFQNTVGVFGAEHLSDVIVANQIQPLIEDFEIGAVKTGMLPTPEIIETIARLLIDQKIGACVVVDPVIRTTSGFDLIDEFALEAMVDRLFPIASLVTPNIMEAERLAGIQIAGKDLLEEAARRIREMGPEAVLITGGDKNELEAVDVLLDSSGIEIYSGKRVDSTNTHGTGCTLASSLTSLLALGHSLREAIPIAKTYVAAAIASAPGLGRGHGPLNHLPPGFPRS